LYPYFDRKFIFDSFSCRRDKGAHRAINRFRQYGRIISQNHTRTAWILKCDIKKFFANIDHEILKEILAKYIKDIETLQLLEEIIGSFHEKDRPGKGLPLGNLTSQLLVNIYMNELDWFLKRELKIAYCVRYADDFVLLHENREYLGNLIPEISRFLERRLKLSLHPDKVFIKTLSSGVDFLGWVHFPRHRVLRTTTKRRMLRKLAKNQTDATKTSYMGLLKHGDTYLLMRKIEE
jgi:retron-type reverse transcriptase